MQKQNLFLRTVIFAIIILTGCSKSLITATTTQTRPIATQTRPISTQTRPIATQTITPLQEGPTQAEPCESNKKPIVVYFFDENGKALCTEKGCDQKFPILFSFRMKLNNASRWEPPVTISSRDPANFSGSMYRLCAAQGDQVVMGVYPPIGFLLQSAKYTSDDQSCTWLPNSEEYSIYARSAGDDHREPLKLTGDHSMCFFFKYVRDSDYKYFGKLKGIYENSFSDSVQKFNSDELRLLELPPPASSTEEPKVSVEVSQKYGGTIQHLSISDSTGNNSIQIINNAHPTDSGMQWTALVKGVKSSYEGDSYSSNDCNLNTGPTHKCPYPLFQEWKQNQPSTGSPDFGKFYTYTAYNQMVGGDTTWMWGMENPLELIQDVKNNKVTFQTRKGFWVPLFSDFVTAIPGDSDAKEFRPRSPLYLPIGAHILDGRTEELSLSKISVPNHGSISRIIFNYLVRSHQQIEQDIGYYKTFLWSSYNRRIAVDHHMKLRLVLADNQTYYFGDTAQPTQSSVERNWTSIDSIQKKFNPKCKMNEKNETTSCEIPLIKDIKRVILSYQLDPKNPKSEVFLAIHRKDQTPFNLETGWNNGSGGANQAFRLHISFFIQGLNVYDKETGPIGLESDHFTMEPNYFNGDGRGTEGDMILFSVGRKDQLDALGLGF